MFPVSWVHFVMKILKEPIALNGNYLYVSTRKTFNYEYKIKKKKTLCYLRQDPLIKKKTFPGKYKVIKNQTN